MSKTIPNTHGYIPSDNDFSIKQGDTSTLVSKHLKNNQRGGNQTRHLEEIFNLCHQNSIKLYVVIPPARKDYLENLNNHKKEDLYKECFDFTSKNQIPLLDAMNDESFKDTEFFDCDHLNRIGAEHLTELINKFIND